MALLFCFISGQITIAQSKFKEQDLIGVWVVKTVAGQPSAMEVGATMTLKANKKIIVTDSKNNLIIEGKWRYNTAQKTLTITTKGDEEEEEEEEVVEIRSLTKTTLSLKSNQDTIFLVKRL